MLTSLIILRFPLMCWKKMRKRKPVSFRLTYSFSDIISNGYYPTKKNGVIDLITKVSMLYDSKGELINYLFINLDNTDKMVDL